MEVMIYVLLLMNFGFGNQIAKQIGVLRKTSTKDSQRGYILNSRSRNTYEILREC